MFINAYSITYVDLLLYLAGDDYNNITNTRLVFNPGVSTQTVTLTTFSDVLSEGDENLTAIITADSGVSVFAHEASVTITSMSPCVCICSDIYTCTYCSVIEMFSFQISHK